MTDSEYKILSFICTKNQIPWCDVLNEFSTEPGIIGSDAILRGALASGNIEAIDAAEKPPHCSIRLTKKGIRTLLEAEEERAIQESFRQENIRKEQEEKEENRRILEAERTARKKEKRSDRYFQVFLVILEPFVTFIIGIILEHFIGIVDFIVRLFS